MLASPPHLRRASDQFLTLVSDFLPCRKAHIRREATVDNSNHHLPVLNPQFDFASDRVRHFLTSAFFADDNSPVFDSV